MCRPGRTPFDRLTTSESYGYVRLALGGRIAANIAM